MLTYIAFKNAMTAKWFDNPKRGQFQLADSRWPLNLMWGISIVSVLNVYFYWLLETKSDKKVLSKWTMGFGENAKRWLWAQI